MLKLQQVLMDHFFQTTSQRVQSLSPEDQQSPQTSWKWIKRMGFLMSRMANLIRAEATKELKFKEPLPHSDPRCDIKAGQQALPSWQPDQPSPRLGGFEAAFVGQVLSRRGTGIYDLYCASFQSYEAYQRDKYHKEENPMVVLMQPADMMVTVVLLDEWEAYTEAKRRKALGVVWKADLCVRIETMSTVMRSVGTAGQGYINLGTSENKLCLDLIKERLSQCDMNQIEDDLLQYSDWQGHPFLRKELASFLTCYCRAPTPLDPENVVVLNGCSSVFSSLAMVLCDPGDAFLIPTPCYSGFAFSSCLYSKVELIPVYLESQLTMDMLELILTQAKMKEKKVKGLVLVNPQNPLGEVYTRSMLKEYLVFAKKHNLHVIIDEIYMLSVFDASITFHSVLNIKHLPDPNKTHMIWGTSKDFGISGFRFGVLYTHNKEVASAMRAFGYLHSVSGITQFKLCQLLQDREWIDQLYLPTNHSRLRRAYLYVTKRLEKLKVPFFNGGSGLYVWINLRAYLSPCTFDQEQILCQCFQDNKLLLSRGRSYMCKEPGWFRLVFAEDQLQLKVAMDRFCQVLKEHKKDRRLKQLEPAITT